MDDPEGADLGSLGTAALIDRFEQAAIRYGLAEADELSDEMRRQDSVKYEVSREVRRRGREAEAMFLRLLSHENAYVRAEAAMSAIHFAPAAAVPALLGIIPLGGPIGFYARKALAWHQSGTKADWSVPRERGAESEGSGGDSGGPARQADKGGRI